MADFFEQLGKKISDVAEDFGKKTEDTLEVQRIKSQIRSLNLAYLLLALYCFFLSLFD